MPLSSLTQWSQEHIRTIFESRSDTDAISAIDQTFAPSLTGTINGKVLTYENVKQLVLAIRDTSSSRSLEVEWQNAVEFPADAQNRDGAFEGRYVIHGIFKGLPGYDRPVQFARHKTVTVRIESLSAEHCTTVDSRRIVELALTATDKCVDDQPETSSEAESSAVQSRINRPQKNFASVRRRFSPRRGAVQRNT